jgi:hypothetical protein
LKIEDGKVTATYVEPDSTGTAGEFLFNSKHCQGNKYSDPLFHLVSMAEQVLN